MIKHFCDLCDKPAMEHWPSLIINFEDRAWYGVKSSYSSNVDGKWVPYVEGRIVFDMHNEKRHISPRHPDLCADCVEKLLIFMAELVKKNNSNL